MFSPHYVLALTAALAVLTGAQKQEYCSVKYCNGPVHSLCKYPFLTVSSQCGKTYTSTMTEAEKQEVLKAHNDLRAFVASGAETRGNPGPQPGSTNLGDLTWDDELANIAQTWADQCIPGHDTCRHITRFRVGQNYAYRGTSGDYSSITLKQLVQDWYDEVDDLNPAEIEHFTGTSKAGHYTQLVWADSKLVGCGVIRHQVRNMNRVVLVCNYGPLGNFNQGPVYKTSGTSVTKPAIVPPTSNQRPNSRPASPQPPNSRPASPQPPNSRPASPQPPNSRPASPQRPNSRPASPQPPNSRPASPQRPNSRPASPQRPNSRPASPQPPNSRPAPTQRPNVRPTTNERPNSLRPVTDQRPDSTTWSIPNFDQLPDFTGWTKSTSNERPGSTTWSRTITSKQVPDSIDWNSRTTSDKSSGTTTWTRKTTQEFPNGFKPDQFADWFKSDSNDIPDWLKSSSDDIANWAEQTSGGSGNRKITYKFTKY